MSLWIWKVALILRVLLVFLPQNGYIHPDEFFQSTEVIAGDIFNFKTYRPWEFNSTFPIRCIVFPYLTVGIPFIIFEKLLGTLFFLNRSPYLLLIIPRLIMVCLSIIEDWCLYNICKMFKRNHINCLTTFSTSYITLVLYTRTLNNSIESLLFSLLLLVISKVIHQHSQIKNNYRLLNKIWYVTEIGYSNTIGILLAFGFYNRPTFMLFAAAPVLFWLQLGLNQDIYSQVVLFRRLLTIMPSFIGTSLCLTIIDTLYYLEWTFVDLISQDICSMFEQLIYTPLNFITYNLDSSNLAVHGIHPRFLHMLVNVPLLFGVLGIQGILYYIQIVINFLKGVWPNELQPHNALMLMSFIFPVLTLSVFSHQEPRFLIPLLIPLCFMFSNSICGSSVKKRLLFTSWCLSNLTCGIFFGLIHQAGIIPGLLSMHKILLRNTEMKLMSHVVFYHTYMPPRHLLALPSNDIVTIHDMFGSDKYALENSLNSIIKNSNSKLRLYILIPSSIDNIFTDRKQYVLLESFFPHFSSEDPPDIFNVCHKTQCTVMETLLNSFSLNLYQVKSE